LGQARQRKEEIMMLKEQNPKVSKKPLIPTKIVGFGAYYKDLDDDGVSIHLSPAFGIPQGFVSLMYEKVKECVELEGAEMSKGNYEYYHGAKNRSEAIASIWEQLHFCIKEFNLVVFKSSVRPKKSTHQCRIDEDFLTYAMPIMTNIWHLQNLGEIPNDNYNGMTFAYTN
jgi:hypothetical protein